MGCCGNRDKSSKNQSGANWGINVARNSTLIVLHLAENKPDVRIVRLLKCMIDLKGNTLEITATKASKLPGLLPLYPVLEYQGRVLSGEIPILQYVGRMEGFYPQMSHYDQYLTESLVAEVMDCWEKVEEGAIESVLEVMKQVEKRLPEGSQFYGGKKLSIADVALYDFLCRNYEGETRKFLPPRLSTYMRLCEHEFPEAAKKLVLPS